MAYTKYSLTPANNNAAPPDGAPEGMLPSAVNDTMRDMMAQIRDCGDGIRGGTYTMTAPVITGGSINGATIGGTTAGAGTFTNLAYTGTLTGGTGVVNLGSGQFYKDASGGVGLGTTSPTSIAGYGALTINGSGSGSLVDLQTSGTLQARILSLPADLRINQIVSGSLSLYTSNTERMRIDSSGNVGIGTSSPYSVANYTGLTLNGTNGSTFSLFTNGTRSFTAYSTTGAVVMGSVASVPLVLNTGDTERMRIDSSGNLLVGTTSATSRSGVTAKLVSSSSNQDGMYSKVDSNSYFTFASHVSTTSGTRYHIGFGDGTTWTERGTISTNGSSTTYSTSSDYRLKENIAPMTGALDVVQQLKPVTYNWKADGSSGQGFIAHELQAVVPDCVTGEKDAVDSEGKPKYQGIDTSFLVATLTKAIQEQQVMIEELKAKVAALEAA